jgi:hypothetical protein
MSSAQSDAALFAGRQAFQGVVGSILAIGMAVASLA